MKTLYKVTQVAYVVAEDVHSAKFVKVNPNFADVEVVEATEVPAEWETAVPFGAKSKTCSDFLK